MVKGSCASRNCKNQGASVSLQPILFEVSMAQLAMFFKAENYRHSAFVEGLRDAAPQAPGVAAWGLMIGVAMINSGMSVMESIAMTLLVYAGSSQMAAIPLIAAGAPAWTNSCITLRPK